MGIYNPDPRESTSTPYKNVHLLPHQTLLDNPNRVTYDGHHYTHYIPAFYVRLCDEDNDRDRDDPRLKATGYGESGWSWNKLKPLTDTFANLKLRF